MLFFGNLAVSELETLGFADRPHDRGALSELSDPAVSLVSEYRCRDNRRADIPASMPSEPNTGSEPRTLILLSTSAPPESEMTALESRLACLAQRHQSVRGVLAGVVSGAISIDRGARISFTRHALPEARPPR